jgi:hypothetical protein
VTLLESKSMVVGAVGDVAAAKYTAATGREQTARILARCGVCRM